MGAGFGIRINRTAGDDAGAIVLPSFDTALIDSTGTVSQSALESLLSGAGISSMKVKINGTVYRIMLLANA